MRQLVHALTPSYPLLAAYVLSELAPPHWPRSPRMICRAYLPRWRDLLQNALGQRGSTHPSPGMDAKGLGASYQPKQSRLDEPKFGGGCGSIAHDPGSCAENFSVISF